jgi:hypothetical protein
MILKQDSIGKFGFTMIGAMPVLVHSVDQESMAHQAGLKTNDVILCLNDINVEQKCHQDLVHMVKSSNLVTIKLEVLFSDLVH